MWQECPPATLVSANAGPHLYYLASWRGKGLGRPGPGFRGTDDVTFGRVHRVLYSPQSDRCCCGLLLGQSMPQDLNKGSPWWLGIHI